MSTIGNAGPIRDADSSGGKPMTGRTVLLWLVGFFGVIFAANAVFLWVALGSFPGVVVESSYTAGQLYNQEIAAAREQAARGWAVEAGLDRSAGGTARIVVRARDGAGLPVTGVAFTARLNHPTRQGADHLILLQEEETGRFVGHTEASLDAGNWNLILEAEGGEGRVFRSENRLFLKE
ncbi:FixH family protein [Polymorphum gilvum]|uniref:FixH superfamily n=1 Tax=Polymorphum gilvum (strain LMG 25793 / CGMCC 1.9160 / SL003B-26A1) TaxID=991905 RepID=F2IXK6_POLGS|nr:FixH family protein [Polymorphum gilvum]ADZ71629.1 FixH superfamily [Polymorphum gilvum SL003B-26A1]